MHGVNPPELALRNSLIQHFSYTLIGRPKVCFNQPVDVLGMAFARAHHRMVARFGRFPGRNRALGRAPTAEEAAWIATGGETFGQ